MPELTPGENQRESLQNIPVLTVINKSFISHLLTSLRKINILHEKLTHPLFEESRSI